LLVAVVSASCVIAEADTIGTGAANAARFIGTPRADHLIGTPQADVLRGLAGPDILDGGRGADQLYAGPGDDRIDARDAEERTTADNIGAWRCLQVMKRSPCLPLPADADVVLAGSGDDTIRTRDGHPDGILCGPGHDLVIADTIDLFSSSKPRSACETVLLSPNLGSDRVPLNLGGHGSRHGLSGSPPAMSTLVRGGFWDHGGFLTPSAKQRG
jgi:hypothetical protein